MKTIFVLVLSVLVLGHTPASAEYADELSQAAAHLQENNPGKALQVLASIPMTSDTGINIAVGMLTGSAYLKMQNFQKAEDTLQKVIDAELAAWHLRLDLAKALAGKNEYRRAYEELSHFVMDFQLKHSKCELKQALCNLERERPVPRSKIELVQKSIADIEKKIPEK